MYRVRKSWDKPGTQLGAYVFLANAKTMAGKHPGFKVFNKQGEQIWPEVPIYAGATDGNVVTLNGKRVQVWNQHKQTGKYKTLLSKHGCGMCCGAMAATLMGRSTTPALFTEMAVALFGARSAAISTAGIVKVLKKIKVSAKRYNVTRTNGDNIKSKIKAALKAGKPVICWTAPNDNKDPFSGGHHYVLAVGYTKEGKVLVANSGGRGPIQLTSLDTLCQYLYHACTGKDTGWCRSAAGSAGIVIVG